MAKVMVNNKVVKRERRVSLTYRVAVRKEKEVMPFRPYVAILSRPRWWSSRA